MRILDIMTPADGRIASWNRISYKHLDFVLDAFGGAHV